MNEIKNNDISLEEHIVPHWLTIKQDYIPVKDKDRFVDKSIFSLLGIISKIKSRDSGKIKYNKVNATLKVAFTFVLLILISLSRNINFLFIVGIYLLLLLSILEGKEILRVVRLVMGIVIFTSLIMVPAAWMGNTYSAIMTTMKVLLSVSLVGILSQTMEWAKLIEALKIFFIPDIFIFVLDITVKYIIMLGEYTVEMLYSLRLRAVGKNEKKYGSLSGVAGNLFLTSKHKAEDMYYAMECRGFTGEYKRNIKFKFGVVDLAYAILNIGFIVCFLYFKGV